MVIFQKKTAPLSGRYKIESGHSRLSEGQWLLLEHIQVVGQQSGSGAERICKIPPGGHAEEGSMRVNCVAPPQHSQRDKGGKNEMQSKEWHVQGGKCFIRGWQHTPGTTRPACFLVQIAIEIHNKTDWIEGVTQQLFIHSRHEKRETWETI